MKNYISISKVKAKTIRRVTTGQAELDWLYGVSEFSDGKVWGMPVGTISTWVGEGGVGKSRLAINVAKDKVKDGKTVLYFQNEVDLPTLASWVNDKNLDNFFCSEETALVQQANIISHLRPDLVFVDSINLIDEFGTGTARSIKTIIDGLRKAIRGTECHVIILCQLNKEGSATGSTALTHLPDVNINLTKTDEDSTFKLSIGKKNRYGRTGSTYHGLWKHIETGVECISKNRLADDRWFKTDGYKTEFVDFGERRDREIYVPPLPDLPNTESGITESGITESGITESGITESGIYVPPLPCLGPQLVKNAPVTLENCSSAVKEAYYTLRPKERPTLLKGFIKFAKKNWHIKE